MQRVANNYAWTNVFMSISELKELLGVPRDFVLKSVEDIGPKADPDYRILVVFERGVPPKEKD